ncbi:hypothetical protein CPB84DRAFT_1828368, partial [Gymnopilus junonius]
MSWICGFFQILGIFYCDNVALIVDYLLALNFQSRLVSGHCVLSSCSASFHSIMEPDLPPFFLLQ